MNEMIARCVAALEEVDIDATKTEDIVRIVIGAMREPPQTVNERGHGLWRAMIDAALKP